MEEFKYSFSTLTVLSRPREMKKINLLVFCFRPIKRAARAGTIILVVAIIFQYIRHYLHRSTLTNELLDNAKRLDD